MEAIQNRLFDALSNGQRRRILFTLLEREDQINIDSPPDGVEDRHGAAIDRRHVHLPKLADYGFIEWDQRANVATRGPQFAEIEPMLRVVADNRELLPVTLE
ncbi:hypothetical protein JMJ58_05210 [Haloterrigena salifodinae]|uniref:DUF7344 domain-containing protein n=1 Tax=Haloterrigena salifodinae TaxID=2675099 RepID=A0A8T8E402_9EURY|nr:hypothetical protein [Haloterrigena salifodinae]QRV16293.1 hypothetical protein JMJ58_05210 [Haloterrigena salifodinae]